MPKKGKFAKKGHHQEHHKKSRGSFRVDNFPGTLPQLKTWVYSMYSQYKGEMRFREMGDHYVIEYYKDFMAEKILQLNGAQFAGIIVAVSPITMESNGSGKRPLTEIIQKICMEGYNKEDSSMDLSHLAEKLAAEGYTKHLDLPLQTKFIDHLKSKYPTTISIDYGFNGLTSLHIFRDIHQSMPQLFGLNLSNNNIKSLDQLEHIKDIPLGVLSLINNPILGENGFNFKVKVLFPNLELLNLQNVNTSEFFTVSVNQRVPPLKIGHFQDYQTFTFSTNFFNTYFTALDTKTEALLSMYKNDAVLTVSTQGNSVFLNGFSNYNRNHSENISQNEYTSRLIVGPPRIYSFFKDKYKTVTHERAKIAYDVTLCPIQQGLNLLNVVCFGQLTHPKESIAFQMTFLLMQGNGPIPFMICNQTIQLYAKKSNFTMVSPSHDARVSIERLEQFCAQYGLSMQNQVFRIAYESNFDCDVTLNKLNTMEQLIKQGIGFLEAFRICKLYTWNLNMMNQDLYNRFGSDVKAFVTGCLQQCEVRGILG